MGSSNLGAPSPSLRPATLPFTSAAPSMASGGTSDHAYHASMQAPIEFLPEAFFRSTLPLCISLSSVDVSPAALAEPSLAGRPLVYHTTARRCSYLPLLLSDVRRGLVDLLLVNGSAIGDEDMWFEYAGQPLKWHWPIGLLYDFTVNNLGLVDGESPSGPSGSSNSSTFTPPIPWRITLRLRNAPTAKLPLPLPSTNPIATAIPQGSSPLVESTKQAFMSLLKEGDYVRNGNTKKVNNLRREEQDGIWEGLMDEDWARYRGLIGKVLPNAHQMWPEDEGELEQRPGTSGDTTTDSSDATSSTGAIPNRISSLANPSAAEQGDAGVTAVAPAEAAASGGISTLKGQPLDGLRAIPVRFVLQGGIVLSEAVPPLNAEGKAMRLGEALHGFFPALFPSSLVTINDASGAGSASAERPSPHQQEQLAVAVLQGVRVPMESTMHWLTRAMSGAEGWLSIVILLVPR